MAMTNALLYALLDAGTAPWTPPTTPPTPPPGDTVKTSAWPTLTDGDTITPQVRPPESSHAATIVLAKDGSGDATTFPAAIDLAVAKQYAWIAAHGRTQATPNDRVLISVKPGTYGEPVSRALPTFISVVASDPTPGATAIEYGLEIDGGTYWEGVDVINPTWITTFDPKYAFHVHAGASIIFARCEMANRAKRSGGSGTPIGMDGLAHSTILMHRVTLTTGVNTNLHGWEKFGPGDGMDVIFSECTFDGGSFYYTPMNDQSDDHLWVHKCVGRAIGIDGTNAHAHVSESRLDVPAQNVDRLTSFAGCVGTLDDRSDWPVPTGGLSARDKQKWGLS